MGGQSVRSYICTFLLSQPLLTPSFEAYLKTSLMWGKYCKTPPLSDMVATSVGVTDVWCMYAWLDREKALVGSLYWDQDWESAGSGHILPRTSNVWVILHVQGTPDLGLRYCANERSIGFVDDARVTNHGGKYSKRCAGQQR